MIDVPRKVALISQIVQLGAVGSYLLIPVEGHHEAEVGAEEAEHEEGGHFAAVFVGVVGEKVDQN